MHSHLMTSILFLTILFPNCLSAQDSDSTLLVHVDVEKPMQWSVEQLKGKFANQVQEIKERGMPDRLGKTAVEIPLLPAIQAAGPQENVRTPTKQVRAPRQVSYELPEGQQLAGLIVSAIAVSPDGKQFVYSTPQGLYRYSADGSPAKHITGTEGFTEQPFFSPDGKWIGYFTIADQKLKKVAINGGVPISICDVAQLAGAIWYKNNTIVFGQFPGDIMRVSANGGTPEAVVKAKGSFLYYPQVLPDGKSVLYSSTTGGAARTIRVHFLKSGVSKDLFPGVWAQYLPTGHLAYRVTENSSSLFIVPFNLSKFRVTGEAIPIIQDVRQSAVSNSGTLIYLPGSASADVNNQRTLVWVDREGKEEALLAQPNFYKYPNISPDGTRVAFTDYGGKIHDIWVWDWIRGTLTKLTSEGKDNICPVWTPDGKRIAFFSFGHGSSGTASGIYWKAADGMGQDDLLSSTQDRLLFPYSWSSDGKKLVGAELTAAMDKTHIGMLLMEGERTQQTLVQQAMEGSPKISPDGRWLAYSSAESGQTEIYVRPFPEGDRSCRQISTSGGSSPLWSPDGRELFYLNGDAVMAVSMKTETGSDIIGTPKVLFHGTYIGPYMGEGTPWDISRDGKRFLMIKPLVSAGSAPAAAGPRKINIIMNWFEELKKREPIK